MEYGEGEKGEEEKVEGLGEGRGKGEETDKWEGGI